MAGARKFSAGSCGKSSAKNIDIYFLAPGKSGVILDDNLLSSMVMFLHFKESI